MYVYLVSFPNWVSKVMFGQGTQEEEASMKYECRVYVFMKF